EGARLVYVDVQYRDAEYLGEAAIPGDLKPLSRQGWGHSTPFQLHAMLSRCKTPPKQVLIGHHDPVRDDTDLAKFEGEVHELLANILTKVEFARDCMIV